MRYPLSHVERHNVVHWKGINVVHWKGIHATWKINIELIFASNLFQRDRNPKITIKFTIKKKSGLVDKRRPLTPSPFSETWSCRTPAFEIPPRLVLTGPLISWPKNASCFQLSLWASRTPLPQRRWVTTCCHLPLHLYSVPLSGMLQPLVKLLLFKFGPCCCNLSELHPICHETLLGIGLLESHGSQRLISYGETLLLCSHKMI